MTRILPIHPEVIGGGAKIGQNFRAAFPLKQRTGDQRRWIPASYPQKLWITCRQVTSDKAAESVKTRVWRIPDKLGKKAPEAV